jgi:hypothetical protein
MKKILLILVAVISFGIMAANAQDVILKKDGSEIKAKVLEITEQQIKYKEFDFQSGPTRNVNITDVFMITYENGKKEVFNKQTSTYPSPSPYYNPYQYTQNDLKNAKNLRNSGVVFFSTGMAFTFPIGLSLLFTAYDYYNPYYGYYRYGQELASLCFIGIGPALTVSGIIMWAVGQTRMDKINRFNPNGFSLFENEKVQFNLAIGGNCMGLKLNF